MCYNRGTLLIPWNTKGVNVMNRVIAIYARKSVERVDSISIESQIEFCQYETRGSDFKIYSDNGYSGKNTARPAFNNMINDIKSGKISAVVVYKLDRISRSILDFSNMMELFQKYDVNFISATEKFDTSSPMGRAMLNICIVFAQLERETIQQRVADAYSARSKKGFYMGGKIPYGFSKVPIVLNGVHTSKYVRNDIEAEDIRKIYEMYSLPTVTLGDVLRELNKESPYNKRGKLWSTARLSELIRNPVYCKADYSIYEFYKSYGANIYNEIEDFQGINGLYMYKGDNPNRKTWDLKDREIVVAPHEGLVESDLWLKCRKKILGNHQVKESKPKNSWLCGVVKCNNCGYASVIKKSKTKAGRYFVCSCAMCSKNCTGIGRTVYADELEQSIKKEIECKINSLSITAPVTVYNEKEKHIEQLKLEISKLDDKIAVFIEKLEEADTALMKHINNKVTELENKKQVYIRELDELERSEPDFSVDEITDCMSVWDIMSFDDKRAIVKILIKRIFVSSTGYSIEWNV